MSERATALAERSRAISAEPRSFLAERLADALESASCACSGVRVAPTMYAVGDPVPAPEMTEGSVEALERNLARYLTALATLRGYLLPGPVTVSVRAAPVVLDLTRTGGRIVCAYRPAEWRALAAMHRAAPGPAPAGSACRLAVPAQAG